MPTHVPTINLFPTHVPTPVVTARRLDAWAPAMEPTPAATPATTHRRRLSGAPDPRAAAATTTTATTATTTTAAGAAGFARGRPQARRLLGVVQADFEVVADLSLAGFQNADLYQAVLLSTLQAGIFDGSLTAALDAACGCVLEVSAVAIGAKFEYPTLHPTPVPTPVPTLLPTPAPTPVPSLQPTPVPTLVPTPVPTLAPTPLPSLVPTPLPSGAPTPLPTPVPTPGPTPVPTPGPTAYCNPHIGPDGKYTDPYGSWGPRGKGDNYTMGSLFLFHFDLLSPRADWGWADPNPAMRGKNMSYILRREEWDGQHRSDMAIFSRGTMAPRPERGPHPYREQDWLCLPNACWNVEVVNGPKNLRLKVRWELRARERYINQSTGILAGGNNDIANFCTLNGDFDSVPTPQPTASSIPTPLPSEAPTPFPTGLPTLPPSPMPSKLPTPLPSSVPTLLPSILPTMVPTLAPTPVPTLAPTPAPTQIPTPLPTISCDPGKFFDPVDIRCKNCQKGRYLNATMAPWPTECTICPPGTAAIIVGQTKCKVFLQQK